MIIFMVCTKHMLPAPLVPLLFFLPLHHLLLPLMGHPACTLQRKNSVTCLAPPSFSLWPPSTLQTDCGERPLSGSPALPDGRRRPPARLAASENRTCWLGLHALAPAESPPSALLPLRADREAAGTRREEPRAKNRSCSANLSFPVGFSILCNNPST